MKKKKKKKNDYGIRMRDFFTTKSCSELLFFILQFLLQSLWIAFSNKCKLKFLQFLALTSNDCVHTLTFESKNVTNKL